MSIVNVNIKNTSGIEDGSDVHPYSKIQKAVDAANAGDTVKVAAGDYRENVMVNKAVNIEGSGTDITTVKALSEHEDVFSVKSNDVKIMGFNIIGGSGSSSTYPNGVSLRGVSNVVITNNIISNIKFAGVLLSGIAESNLIEFNKIYSNIPWSFGVMISQARNNKIVSNEISKVYRGIYIESSGPNNDNVIIKNTITNISYRAFEIWGDTSGITIENNNIYNNSGYNFYNCAVSVGGGSAQNIKAQNNYWGTTDHIEIDAKIYDHKDNSAEGVVDYEPFLQVPFEMDITSSPSLTLVQSLSSTKHTPITLTGRLKAKPTKTTANIALNKEKSGYPSPLKTDVGYNSTYGKWYLIDGVTNPGGYWEGIAFTGSASSWWKEFQHITLDFGAPKTFNQIEVWDRQGGPNLWYRGKNKKVEYWDGLKWIEITGGNWSLQKISYYENPVIYSFSPVVATKVRFSCVPTDWMWISEFRVLTTKEIMPEVQVFVNGMAQDRIKVNTDGSFSVDVDLNEGENRIVARAFDATENNIAESQTSVTILDMLPPEPPALKILPSIIGTAEIIIEGNAELNSNVELFVNDVSKGTIKANNDGDFTLTVKLDEGMNEIISKATDMAGNISTSSAPIFVSYQIHPLWDVPIMDIMGVGKVYSEKLEAHGVNTIADMVSVDVSTLSENTDISLYKLHMWKRRAILAMDVKIDQDLFSDIQKIELGDIITLSDEELSSKAHQPIEIIPDLKKDISALFISLDNDIVKSMTIESLAT